MSNQKKVNDEEHLDCRLPPRCAVSPPGQEVELIESSLMANFFSDVDGLLGTSRSALKRELDSLH